MGEIVKGSIQDIANCTGQQIAELFIDVDLIAIFDSSGSMSATDLGDKTRYQRACDALKTLQNDNPGRIAIITFSDKASWCFDGIPEFLSSNTNLAGALAFAKTADNKFVKMVVISDGQPDNEESALSIAQTMEAEISTIYIGPENGSGKLFLERLAKQNGGKFHKNQFALNLGETVQRMLTG